jgi:Tfp pilus assembly protein PilN
VKTKRINLLPPAERGDLKASLPAMLGLLVLPTVLYLSYATISEYRSLKLSESELRSTNQNLIDIKREIASTISNVAMTGKNRKYKLVNSIVNRPVNSSDLLKELSLVTPQGAWLESVTVDYQEEKAKSPNLPHAPTATSVLQQTPNVAPDTWVRPGLNKMVISGEATEQAIVSRFFVALESSYFFRNVSLKFAERDNEKRNVFKFQFVVNLDPSRSLVSRGSQ